MPKALARGGGFIERIERIWFMDMDTGYRSRWVHLHDLRSAIWIGFGIGSIAMDIPVFASQDDE